MNKDFSLDPNIIYLNHAAVSPLPVRTVDAIQKFAIENGTSGARYYPKWLKIENELRELLVKLINAPSVDDISLLKSTSEGLSVIAYGLDWSYGDNIITIAQEFPSNRIVWESLEKAYGVQVRFLDINNTDNPENDMMNLCDENTRLISVSSVQYVDGFRLNLEKIGKFTQEKGILFCVDAIQSLGALPFDVQAIGADFVVADGHKWMLGPEGLALFYTKKSIRNRLKLRQFGWHMVQDRGDFYQKEWSISHTGTRFECGSPNMLGIHALHASLSIHIETGIDNISRNIFNNTALLIDIFNYSPIITLVTSDAVDRISGIVTLKIDGATNEQLDNIYARLMSEGIICAPRGGGIRFSPHYYNNSEDIELAVKKLEGLAAK